MNTLTLFILIIIFGIVIFNDIFSENQNDNYNPFDDGDEDYS